MADSKDLTPAQRVEQLSVTGEETKTALAAVTETVAGYDAKFTSLDTKLDKALEALAKKPEADKDAEAVTGQLELREGAALLTEDGIAAKVVEIMEAKASSTPPKVEGKDSPDSKTADEPTELEALAAQFTEMKTELADLKTAGAEASNTKTPGDEGSAVDGAGGASSEADAGAEKTLTWLEMVAADTGVNPLNISAEDLDTYDKGEEYSMTTFMRAGLKFGAEEDWSAEKAKQFAAA